MKSCQSGEVDSPIEVAVPPDQNTRCMHAADAMAQAHASRRGSQTDVAVWLRETQSAIRFGRSPPRSASPLSRTSLVSAGVGLRVGSFPRHDQPPIFAVGTDNKLIIPRENLEAVATELLVNELR